MRTGRGGSASPKFGNPSSQPSPPRKFRQRAATIAGLNADPTSKYAPTRRGSQFPHTRAVSAAELELLADAKLSLAIRHARVAAHRDATRTNAEKIGESGRFLGARRGMYAQQHASSRSLRSPRSPTAASARSDAPARGLRPATFASAPRPERPEVVSPRPLEDGGVTAEEAEEAAALAAAGAEPLARPASPGTPDGAQLDRVWRAAAEPRVSRSPRWRRAPTAGAARLTLAIAQAGPRESFRSHSFRSDSTYAPADQLAARHQRFAALLAGTPLPPSTPTPSHHERAGQRAGAEQERWSFPAQLAVPTQAAVGAVPRDQVHGAQAIIESDGEEGPEYGAERTGVASPTRAGPPTRAPRGSVGEVVLSTPRAPTVAALLHRIQQERAASPGRPVAAWEPTRPASMPSEAVRVETVPEPGVGPSAQDGANKGAAAGGRSAAGSLHASSRLEAERSSRDKESRRRWKASLATFRAGVRADDAEPELSTPSDHSDQREAAGPAGGEKAPDAEGLAGGAGTYQFDPLDLVLLRLGVQPQDESLLLAPPKREQQRREARRRFVASAVAMPAAGLSTGVMSKDEERALLELMRARASRAAGKAGSPHDSPPDGDSRTRGNLTARPASNADRNAHRFSQRQPNSARGARSDSQGDLMSARALFGGHKAPSSRGVQRPPSPSFSPHVALAQRLHRPIPDI